MSAISDRMRGRKGTKWRPLMPGVVKSKRPVVDQWDGPNRQAEKREWTRHELVQEFQRFIVTGDRQALANVQRGADDFRPADGSVEANQ